MITVILLQPETPGNIGFIARAMANFDLSELILIDPKCNHFDRDSLLISKHANNIIEKAKIKKYSYFKKLKDDFDLVVGTTSVLGSDYNIPRTPLIPEQLAERISKKTALVFGNEGTGLNNKEIRACDFIISIPTSKKYSAMNISHAATIIFYELYKAKGKNKINSHIEKASSIERKIMLEKLDNIMENLEFTTEDKKETQRITWKRIIEQSMMSKREAQAVLGLLTKLEDSTNN